MMKQKLFLICLFGYITFSITSCDKCNMDCFTPPGPLVFEITSIVSGNDLIFTDVYNPDSIAIFYVDENMKRYVDTEIYADSINQASRIYSHDISWKSVEGFKDFYLYLNHQETDTIFFDVITRIENCCTSHPVMSFTINGNKVEYDDNSYVYNYKK